MGAQRGLDLLLKLGDGGSPENFNTVAGLRATSLSLNTQTIDVTHATSADRWRELLGDAGVKAASVTGAVVFTDDASATALRDVFFSGAARRWRIIVPGLGTIEGAFILTNLDYAGDYDGEATMSASLASAGVLTFTAA